MYNIMRKFFGFLLIFSLILFIAGCGKKEEEKSKELKAEVSLKLGHVLDIQHPVHKGMVYWAEKVKEKSNGMIEITVYPSGQLGMEKELVEQLQMGTLDFTKVSSAALEAFVPEMKVFGMPYIFSDEEHKWKTLNGAVGKEILNSCNKKGLTGLGYYEAGWRSFYTIDTPIKTPEDLNHLKIRVIKSPMAIKLIKYLGASPTPISWGELYTALQQGTVDGAENNPPSLVTAKHYEVCKYYSLDQHTSPMDVVIASQVRWNKLKDEDKKIIMDALMESVEYQRGLWKEIVKENFKVLEDNRVTIIYPDKEPFRKKVQPMYDEFSKDPVIGPLIEKIKNVKVETE